MHVDILRSYTAVVMFIYTGEKMMIVIIIIVIILIKRNSTFVLVFAHTHAHIILIIYIYERIIYTYIIYNTLAFKYTGCVCCLQEEGGRLLKYNIKARRPYPLNFTTWVRRRVVADN